MADWWNPSTWFQQDNSTGQDPNQPGLDQASLEEEERKKRLQEAQGRLAAAKTQEEWQQIAGEYSDLGDQLGGAPSGLPSQADIDAQETLKQQLAGAKTQEEWQSILDGSNIPDKSQFALPQELPTQAGIDEQARIKEAQQSPYTSTVEQESAAGAKNQYLAERERQNDIWGQLQEQWDSIATTNERFWAHREPYTLPITRDMVTNNPLELNLNGLRVSASSPEEMAEMLRYMTDNRGFLPSGGTPLGGTGTMSFAQYKTAVENQQVLNTPEKEYYDYWRGQMGVNRKYEDATSYFENKGYFVLGNEILNTDGQKMKVDDFRGIDAAYAERVMKGYTRRNPEAEDKLAEAYTQYADSVNQGMQPSWTLDPQERDVLTTPNGWKVYKGDQYNAAYYKDENGESYTAAQVLNDPALMKRFSESITPDMVKQFGQKVKANPDLLENLVFQIGDTPETRALLDKTYPEYKANGVLDKYWEIMRLQKLPPAPQDVTGQPYDKWKEFANLFKDWDWNSNLQVITDGNIPDNVKVLAMDMALADGSTGTLVEKKSRMDIVKDAFIAGISGLLGRNTPYDEWNPPALLSEAWKPLITSVNPLAAQILTNPLREAIDFFNPVYWMIGGEAAGVGEQLIGKMASRIVKGEAKEAILESVAKGIPKGEAEAAFSKAEARVEKAVAKEIFPEQAGQKPMSPKSTSGTSKETISPTGKTGVQGETAPASKKLEPGQQPEKVGIEGSTEQPQGQMFENKPTTYRDLQEGKANIEKINADIETKKQNVKAAWDDFMAKSGERGAFSPDGDEAGKKLYGEMVDLAKLYVQKGYRTVEEFAKEMGIKVNDAVRAAWAEANGKARLTGYDNLSDDLRRKLRDIDVPEQQPVKEGFAGNIRLEKYGEEVQDIIKEWSTAHPGQVANARRGIRSDAEVLAEGQRLAEEVGSGFYKKTQNWKPGQAWTAEEITALRGALESKSNEVLELSKAITEGGDTTKDMLRLVTALEEHTNLQKALTGVTAEAGRALRSFRQAAFDSLKANDTQRMEELLKRIGDKKDIQKVAEALSKLDVSDPVAVNSFIRSVTKPKAGDYLLEIYYNSILSGVRTHLANFSSNTLNAVLSPFERAGAALVDLPLSALQGRSRQRFFGEAAQDIFGMVRGIPEGLRGALYVLKNGYTVEQAGKWEVRTQAFTGKLGAVINAPTRALLAADQLGYAINRTAALRAEAYRLASMEKLKGQQFLDRLEDLFANPTEEMLKNAHARAEKRLFREEPGKLTGAIMNLREKSGIGKFIIPFVRTPANLVKYGIERSPLGIANPDLWKALKAKDPAGAEMVANWLIGSTAATALTLYALDGKITGAPPLSSAEKDEFYRSGKQPYSVKIGDYWVSYQRMEPFNQMFAQVAAFVEAVNNKKNDKDVTKMAGQIAATIGSNFISQTYMEGLSDFLDAFEDPLRYGNKWINRFASGFVPYSGLQRTITQAIDNTIRQPKDIGQTIQAQTPGLSQNVPAKINIYGEADVRESSAFLPLNITSVKNDPVDKALLAADLTPGFVGNSISNIKLDETQHYEYQLLAGQIMRDNLERFIESNPRRDWSSPAGQMVLSRIVSASQTQARNEYLRILSTRGIKPPKKQS